MPISERSLANLRPPWTAESAPRKCGWPEWRRQLATVVGDGRELFETLAALARGRAVPLRDSQGKPVASLDSGESVLLLPTPAIMLGAARELLDRAFGKPVQTVVEYAPLGASAHPLDMSALTDDEQHAIREIAHRLLLRSGGTKNESTDPA